MFSKRRIALAGLLLLLAGATLWWPLPEPLFNQPFSRQLLDENQQLLSARIAADQQWRFKSVASLSPAYQTALIQYEDKRFMHHPGVDPLAIIRAMYLNLKSGRVVSGGSTITMQLARMVYGNRARTLWQKLQELHLALRLEMQLSKTDILNYYAANAPMGGNTVGIDAAAWRYFGRRLAELSWAEAALLAVLPNNPAAMHLSRSRNKLRAKRDFLLHKLWLKGFLSEQDYRLSLLESIPQRPRRWPVYGQHLLDRLSQQYPDQSVFYTSIDRRLTQKIEFITRQHSQRLGAIGIHNLALVVVDNATMQVKAYFGNVAYSQRPEDASHVDIASRPRSSGSTLKPFLYAAMLDNGDITPYTLIPDVPTAYGSYQPSNYDKSFRGAVTARSALTASLNIPAVRMLNDYSYQAFYDKLQALGFSDLFRQPDEYGLSLILGGAEVSLVDLTAAYAGLSRRAQQAVPLNLEPLNYTSSLGWRNQQEEKAAYPLSQGAAWLTLDALSDVTRPGLHKIHRLFAGSARVAWKTGTSYGLRDGWAVGTTEKVTVGVWVGNANGEGRQLLTGTSAAAPVLFDTLNIINDLGWPEEPSGALKWIEVCRENGFLPKFGCPRETVAIPVAAQFEKVSPHHFQVTVDRSTGLRSSIGCNPTGSIISKTFFQLPPSQAAFYRIAHASYRPVPEFDEDCTPDRRALNGRFEVTYPRAGQIISLPRYMSGQQGEVIFRATAKNDSAQLFWHLDKRYLGATQTFHELSETILPGKHLLRVIDQQGVWQQIRFTVIP
ncbi:penicillin-binding protein 1C [Amphritea sp. 2_MG-2023]|uniref:penicillin-binding protein 1C n=1 Tax=Amphritea TaxID=515417 RepID=UPI001C07D494|nr:MULTISPECIES: penicillin-binding protein 1C [Amphritea]MBU2965306.1 penicillin-binding protein 1C [Amphritea atlantica]MDO6420169.1 penicillin-binding protein 1C [Amphritea sp. 2_MG-2023]